MTACKCVNTWSRGGANLHHDVLQEVRGEKDAIEKRIDDLAQDAASMPSPELHLIPVQLEYMQRPRILAKTE